jgi:hypothetical protein
MKKQLGRLGAVVALLGVFLVAGWAVPVSTARADGPNAFHFYFPQQIYQARNLSGESIVKGKLTYHGGPIMKTDTTYAIYWAPSGHPIDAGYQSLINRYFQDISGTKFYNILTQYYMTGGKHIANQSPFGGSWVDTTPYPHVGNGSDPLTDADIQASVLRAISANGWPLGLHAQYFVFTAQGIESCANSTSCTIGTSHPAYCAYHSFFKSGKKPVVYANMPYAGTWKTGFQYNCGTLTTSPNGNEDADLEISVASHEHFEAVSDPKPTYSSAAWYDSHGYEIGDKCAYYYGKVAVDGSNLSLHGHPYIIQLEWSNAAKSGVGNCVKKY